MSLVEKILPYERDLFLWLNGHHTDYWDSFMWMYSGKLVWLPLVLSILFVFIYKVKWRETILLILSVVLVVLLCDLLVSSFFRPLFARPRPTHHPDFEALVHVVNGYRGGNFGFVSSHAANGFGIVTFLALIFRYRYFTLLAFLWAATTCYSRVYLGVHFISDVVGGAIWGVVSAFLVYYIYLTLRQFLLKIPHVEVKVPIIPRTHVNLLLGVLLASILYIAIYSAVVSI